LFILFLHENFFKSSRPTEYYVSVGDRLLDSIVFQVAGQIIFRGVFMTD